MTFSYVCINSKAVVAFSVPKLEADGIVNNKKESYKFQFDYVFPSTAAQEDVFAVVAKPVADRFAKSMCVPFVHLWQCIGRIQRDDLCLWADRLGEDLYYDGRHEIR